MPNCGICREPLGEEETYIAECYGSEYECHVSCVDDYARPCPHCHTFIYQSPYSDGEEACCCEHSYTPQYCSCGVEIDQDEEYCAECSADGLLREYSYRPIWKYHTLRGGEPNAVFFGVENEMEVSESSTKRDVIADLLSNPNENQFFLKKDGSISDGFELVTHPRTYASWQKCDLTRFFPSNSLSIIPHKSTGMHVHISRSRLSTYHIYKILRFFYLPSNLKYLRQVAGRKFDEIFYCKTKSQSEITAQFTRYNDGDRYQAVNIVPRYTVEIRIFAGVVTQERFITNIEFCAAMVSFTKQASAEKLEYARFVEYVKKERKTYKHLFSFITKEVTLCA